MRGNLLHELQALGPFVLAFKVENLKYVFLSTIRKECSLQLVTLKCDVVATAKSSACAIACQISGIVRKFPMGHNIHACATVAALCNPAKKVFDLGGPASSVSAI